MLNTIRLSAKPPTVFPNLLIGVLSGSWAVFRR